MATRMTLGLWAAIGMAAQGAHAAKPEVLVEFEIEVPAFTRNLPERAEAQLTVRQALAAEFERQFVFAHWRVAPSDEPQLQLGRLKLRMRYDPEKQPNPLVFVEWWGAGASPGAELRDLGFAPIEIYSSGNPNWDTSSRRDFETRLLAIVMAKVRTSAFRDELFTRFLARLPIGSSIVPHAADRVIEIPVQWNELLLSSESELVVRFDKSTDQTKQEGTMTLGQIAARVGGASAAPPAFTASLRGSITKASFDAQTIVLDAQNWNDALPEILNGASAACYISVYKPRDELAGDADRFGL